MSGLFRIFDRIDYEDAVSRRGKSRGRAKEAGVEHCTGCGACCAKMPCLPTPDEVVKIAEFLDMSLEDCVKEHFIVYHLKDRGMYLIPAKTVWLPYSGQILPAERTFDHGYCTFYDEEKRLCIIHTVKPKSAQETKCWVDSQPLDDEAIYKLWRETDLASMGATIPMSYVAPWDQEESWQ